MREIRPSGLEGGATELNRSFLPLFELRTFGAELQWSSRFWSPTAVLSC